MRIKIMVPKSTAMKTAALKLDTTNIAYSADIDLVSDSSRVPSLNLEPLRRVETLYYKKAYKHKKTQTHLNEQFDVICLDSEDDNIVSSSLTQLDDSKPGILLTDDLHHKKDIKINALRANLIQELNVDLDFEDCNIVSNSLLQVTDPKSEISAETVQCKKSKYLAPNLNEQPDVICLDLEDDDSVCNSLTQVEDSKSGILLFDDLYDKKAMKSAKQLQLPNSVKKSDDICLDFKDCNIVSNSLPLVKDCKSEILSPDDLRYKKIKIKQDLLRNSNEDVHVICLDSEDDDIAATDASHYKKSKQGEVPASNLNEQLNATCMNLDVEDIDSNSLPPIYFSEKEAQEAKNSKLEFSDFKNEECQNLSDGGNKSSALAISRQPQGGLQDFNKNDSQTEHSHADSKKSETSESKVNEQSYINSLACRQDIKDPQMECISKDVFRYSEGIKGETIESNESNQLNQLRQGLEVDVFYKNEHSQKSNGVISTFNERLNKQCHVLEEHGEGASLSPAYLITKHERHKSYNVNLTKQVNVARKGLVHENLQSLCKRAKTSKVLKQNLTEKFNTNSAEYALQHEQANHLKRSQHFVNNDLGKLIIDFSSTEKYSFSKSMYSEKGNKNISSKQNLNQHTHDKEINGNNLQSDLILTASPKIYSDSTAHFNQNQIQEAESMRTSKGNEVANVECQGSSTNGIKTLPKTSSPSQSGSKIEKASFGSLHNIAKKLAASQLNLSESESIKTMQEILQNDKTQSHRELCKKSRDLLPISTNLQTPNVMCQISEECLSEVLSADALPIKKVKKVEMSEPNFTEGPNFVQSNVDSYEVGLESSCNVVDDSHHQIPKEVSSLISTEQLNVVCQEEKLNKSKHIPIVRSNEEQVQEATSRTPISKKRGARNSQGSVGILPQCKKEIFVKHKKTKQHCLPNHDLDKGKNKLNSNAKKSKNLKSKLSKHRNVALKALQGDSIDSNLLPRDNICSKASTLNQSSEDLSDRPNVIATELDLYNSINITQASYPNTLINLSTSTKQGESTIEDRHTNGSVFLSNDAMSNHAEKNFKTLGATFDHPTEETSRGEITISSQKLDEILEYLKPLQEMVQRLTEAQKTSERREIEIMKKLQALKNKAPEIRENWLVENDINLPMRSMDEYRRYCHLLENTSECRKILEAFIHFTFNGKQSLTRNIASVIRKYFAPELACQFTAVKPVKSKFVMAGTTFYNHLLNIFIQKSLSGVICKKLSESDFNKAFKEALCSSKDYYRKKSGKQMDQTTCIME